MLLQLLQVRIHSLCQCDVKGKLVLPNVSEIISGRPDKPNIIFLPGITSKQDAHAKFEQLLMANYTKPIFVFADNWTDNVKKICKAVSKAKGIRFCFIETIEDLNQLNSSSFELLDCIYVLSKKFKRGIDIEMRVNA